MVSKRVALAHSHKEQLKELPSSFSYDEAVRDGTLTREVYYSLVRNDVFREVTEGKNGSKEYTLSEDIERRLDNES